MYIQKATAHVTLRYLYLLQTTWNFHFLSRVLFETWIKKIIQVRQSLRALGGGVIGGSSNTMSENRKCQKGEKKWFCCFGSMYQHSQQSQLSTTTAHKRVEAVKEDRTTYKVDSQRIRKVSELQVESEVKSKMAEAATDGWEEIKGRDLLLKVRHFHLFGSSCPFFLFLTSRASFR
jgi:hypothetical protein